jgi:organic hydroperoxide reductase OsmC/OhrA
MEHNYSISTKWTGNSGAGTKDYKAYERSFSILGDNKMEILGSSDPSFRGDATQYNPEELLVASVSSCHLLWYLHLCSEAGVVVVDYIDHATAAMEQTADGGGHFTEITLNPVVTVSEFSMVEKANSLHKKANTLCFIANSLNFTVHHVPVCKVLEK